MGTGIAIVVASSVTVGLLVWLYYRIANQTKWETIRREVETLRRSPNRPSMRWIHPYETAPKSRAIRDARLAGLISGGVALMLGFIVVLPLVVDAKAESIEVVKGEIKQVDGTWLHESSTRRSPKVTFYSRDGLAHTFSRSQVRVRDLSTDSKPYWSQLCKARDKALTGEKPDPKTASCDRESPVYIYIPETP